MSDHRTTAPASAPIGQATAEHASHALRASALADKIVSTAERGLAPFEMSIEHYPGEFKAIMWDAIAEIAVRRAAAAREQS